MVFSHCCPAELERFHVVVIFVYQDLLSEKPRINSNVPIRRLYDTFNFKNKFQKTAGALRYQFAGKPSCQ